jgi:hypothetical protein
VDAPIPSWAHITPSRGTFDINSLLASLTQPNSTSSSSTPSTSVSTLPPAQKSHSVAGPVTGGVIGGIAVILIVPFLLFRWRRSRKPESPMVQVFNLPHSDVPIATGAKGRSGDGSNSTPTTQPRPQTNPAGTKERQRENTRRVLSEAPAPSAPSTSSGPDTNSTGPTATRDLPSSLQGRPGGFS